MTNPLEQIHLDHVNVSKVLDLIENEINRARAEEMPNLDLLEDAMRYMVNYPDLIHHPKEDSMFARLLQKEPDVSEKVEALRREHVELAALSQAFLEIVRAAETGEFVLRDELIKRGNTYVKTLRAHMDTEESDLLKRARESLSKRDLEEIGREYSDARDPLMEQSLSEEYKALYRSLFE